VVVLGCSVGAVFEEDAEEIHTFYPPRQKQLSQPALGPRSHVALGLMKRRVRPTRPCYAAKCNGGRPILVLCSRVGAVLDKEACEIHMSMLRRQM